MTLADLSIRRPIFITCLFLGVLLLGGYSIKKLGVDLFPNIIFPVVSINTIYPGAGPNEVETLISKPIEDSLSTLSGIKTVRSVNKEGISTITAEFTLESDIKYAEQQIRDRIASVRSKLPNDAQEPVVRTIDPADQPIAVLALSSNLSPTQLYELADHEIRPMIEQVQNVGFVDVLGGRKREIDVLLDRDKLNAKQLSASQVAMQIAAAGKNIPAGKARSSDKESDVRTLGQFESLKDIGSTLVNFYANENPVQVADVAEVKDSLEDEKSRTYVNGESALTLNVYRRSGANTLSVVTAIKERVAQIKAERLHEGNAFDLSLVRDGGRPIQANLDDVIESIIIGILLTIFVVYLFLGSVRSTIITGIAIPNSLLGAFILMHAAGFTINVMTLLAMSLAVGLLIDDAIVVRENIFRHVEMGKFPRAAASIGSKEVNKAVVATTLTVVAVFGSVAFLSGIVGQFFKEFGLTICFAMLISFLDAVTMAPMLSAYFAGDPHPIRKNKITQFFGRVVEAFSRFQDQMEVLYMKALRFSLAKPLTILGSAALIFILSLGAILTVPKTFIPPADNGEFMITLEGAPGTALDTMGKLGSTIDQTVRAHPEVKTTVLTIGGQGVESNEASIFVQLVPRSERKMNTSQFKEIIRSEIHTAETHPRVEDIGLLYGGTDVPFSLNVTGTHLKEIETVSTALFDKIKNHPDLKDVDLSYRAGKPEFRVVLDKTRGEQLGVSTNQLGQELRTQIQGATPAVYRENGQEYTIRVRLKEDQRNLKENFEKTLVPNINNRLIKLADVAKAEETEGPSTIFRQDRGRYIQITAGLNPQGRGISQAMTDVQKIFKDGEVPLPPGVRYQFVGQAESFQELGENMIIAAVLAVIFIFLVLSSLYESFITPLAIMLVLPLAACGAFYALALTRSSFDLFSMIGCIMLLGIATKNSILLVDYINQAIRKGKSREEAILEAGKTRLRPIVMTSIALIAGMLPVAVGLNEASRQRTSMGISAIGGLISSTLLTLVVVPAAYSYIDRFRSWNRAKFRKWSWPEGQRRLTRKFARRPESPATH